MSGANWSRCSSRHLKSSRSRSLPYNAINGRGNMRAAVASMMLVIAVALLSSCATIRSLTPGQDSFQEGMALFNQGHFDSAVEQFRRSTRENPQSAQAYLYLG